MTALSVNINKFALVRNARGANMPDIINISDVNNITIKVNNVEVFNGIDFQSSFVVSAGDEINISVDRDVLNLAKFTIIGNII